MVCYKVFAGEQSKVDIQCAECGEVCLDDTFTHNKSNEILCSRLCAELNNDICPCCFEI
jgi:hypothetical protein